MSIPKLYSGAEVCIQNMHLNKNEQRAVKICILKYLKSDTFCEKLTWIIYRIEQAIRSIFGVSDWQIVKKIIQHRMMQLILEQRIIQENPQNKIQEICKEDTVTLIDRCAERILSLTLLTQQLKIEDSDEFRIVAANAGVDKLIELVRVDVNKINQICPQYA